MDLPSEFSALLNELVEMQKSPYYATRKEVLSEAENTIFNLEQQRNGLIKILSTILDTTEENDDKETKH
jgi:hypothetical protein